MRITNYLLLEMAGREVTPESFITQAQARTKMLKILEEVLKFSPHDDTAATQAVEPRGGSWDYDEDSAWCNFGDETYDWKIIAHSTEIDTNALQEDGSLLIRWTPEDVLQLEPSLTEEEAFTILQEVLDAHDANTGITWFQLEQALETYLQEEKV